MLFLSPVLSSHRSAGDVFDLGTNVGVEEGESITSKKVFFTQTKGEPGNSSLSSLSSTGLRTPESGDTCLPCTAQRGEDEVLLDSPE